MIFSLVIGCALEVELLAQWMAAWGILVCQHRNARHLLRLCFHQRVAGQMAATCGEAPHHRLPDQDGRFQLWLDLGLGF